VAASTVATCLPVRDALGGKLDDYAVVMCHVDHELPVDLIVSSPDGQRSSRPATPNAAGIASRPRPRPTKVNAVRPASSSMAPAGNKITDEKDAGQLPTEERWTARRAP